MIVWMLATLPAGWPPALFKLDRTPNSIDCVRHQMCTCSLGTFRDSPFVALTIRLLRLFKYY